MSVCCPNFGGCCYCCSLCQECCEQCIVAKSKKHPHIVYKSPEEANKSLRTVPEFLRTKSSMFELPQQERFPLHPIFTTYRQTYVVKRQPSPGQELEDYPPMEDDFELEVFDTKPSGPLTHERLGTTDYKIPESLPAGSARLEERLTEPTLKYSLVYDIQLRTLNVHLLKANNLQLAKDTSGSVDPFVAVFLLPGKEVIQQTEVVEKDSNPYFDTVFKFQGIALKDIHQLILVFQVFDHDRFLKDRLIGTVVAPLKNADLYGSSVSTLINGDQELMEKYSHGGLLLSLKYNLPEQQLEGTVIKVSNIPRHHRWSYTDPYVKVYMMHEGVRHSKWKSSMQKYSPVIRVDESFMINIAGVNINNAYLLVRVLSHARLSRDEVLAVACIGPHAEHESGRSHWSDMLLSPGQEFSKWHAFIACDPNRSGSKSPQELSQPEGRNRSGTV